MSSRECDRLVELVGWCCHAGFVPPKEAVTLTEWLAQADKAMPAPPAPQVETRVVLPGTRKRGKGRAEKRNAEREAAHKAEVEKWQGERPLLPHEIEDQRGYGHGDGY